MRKLIVFLDFLLFAAFVFGDLSCTTRNGSCNAGETNLFQMWGLANSHASMDDSYSIKVCCSGIAGLGNDCSAANKAVVLKLAKLTNSHAETGAQSNYPNNVCLSVPSGSISCSFPTTVLGCAASETCVAILDNVTNSHVNECGGGASGTNICCSSIPAIPGSAKFEIVSFVLEPETVVQDAPSKNVKATVKVKNYSSSAATAHVELTVADSSGNNPVLIPATEQAIGASAILAFDFTIGVTNSWNKGIYSATAKVFDTAMPANLHDSKVTYLTVSEIQGAVPEFDITLLPLVALLILAIVLLETKRKN